MGGKRGRPSLLLNIDKDEFKKLIELTGMTHSKLAKHLGIKLDCLTKWIYRGKISPEVLEKLKSTSDLRQWNRFIKIDKELLRETIKATGLTYNELGRMLGIDGGSSHFNNVIAKGVIDREYYHLIWSLTCRDWRESYVFKNELVEPEVKCLYVDDSSCGSVDCGRSL